MEFYEKLSQYYDEIFPLTKAKASFIQEKLPQGEKRVLDVGCATGDLAIFLAQQGYKVKAIDLDEEMIHQAKEKAKKQIVDIDFQIADMMELKEKLEKQTFDGIICIGNTLVHLKDEQEIENVIKQMYQLLNSGGMLILQIINYDRILEQHVQGLPLIETEHIRFERRYSVSEDEKTIYFKTTLEVKEQGETYKMKNEVPLYPLQFGELREILEDVGFRLMEWYGNFKQEPYGPDSYAMIVAAKK